MSERFSPIHIHSSNCHHPDIAKRSQLILALGVLVGFAAVEWAVGTASHSFALVAEAGHMVADGLGLGIALAAAWLAQSPQPGRLTTPPSPLPPSPLPPSQSSFNPLSPKSLTQVVESANRRRAQPETWAALFNGCSLGLLSLLIGWEALQHLMTTPPSEISSWPMLLTALVGLGVNGLNLAVLYPGIDQDLNLRAAFLHVFADALSSVGVIVAAIAVASLHWLWADGVVSLLVAGVIGASALPVMHQSWQRLRA